MKKFIVRFMMLCCYYLKVDSLFYYLNRHAKRVITFHNVMPEDKEAFRRTIREISRRFRFSSDVNDVNTATITFDDGYCNQYEIAAEVLREEGNIPGILFGNAKALPAKVPGEALPIDQIGFWLRQVPVEVLQKETGYSDPREAWIYCVKTRFRSDVDHLGRSVLEHLNSVYPIYKLFEKCDPEWLRLRFTGISESQLDDLRSRGWIIGWHTLNHFPLSCIRDEGVLTAELTPTDVFKNLPTAYPFGLCEDFNETVKKVASKSSFACAFANYDLKDSDNWARRRFTQMDDKYRIHFELSGAKYFFKYRKLLSRY